MFYWKRVFLFALLCLALAGGIARAENEVTIRVTYTGSQTGDEPGVRVYLGTPLTENRPYAEYGTQYERGWLNFVSENTAGTSSCTWTSRRGSASGPLTWAIRRCRRISRSWRS